MSGDQRGIESGAVTPSLPAPDVAGEVTDLDLASCDREPIHVPGSIQPHGFLLALNADNLVVVASGTAGYALQRPVTDLFHTPLESLLGEANGGRIMTSFAREPLTEAPRLLANITLPGEQGDSNLYEVAAYRSGEGDSAYSVVEFEQTEEVVDLDQLNARLFNFIGVIRRTSRQEEICQAACDELQALTGCGRVVLYRFDEQGNGLVLAEHRADPTLPSYLGLRFPASDVPSQARRMYLLNRVRIIPNVDYTASPLLGPEGPVPDLDLSSSILRSVSPIHRQYMRNMGTACSMSVSIVIDGRLWGLVSCHNAEPRYVPLRLRSACDFIVQVVASQIESQQNALHLERALNAKHVQTRLLASMAAEDNYSAGLLKERGALMELGNADGAAVVVGTGTTLIGATPTEAQVSELIDWFKRHYDRDEVFITENLQAAYPRGKAFSANGSGVIICAVSEISRSFIAWFRKERVQTVRWAGDPHKPALPPEQSTLPKNIVHPRHSFEEWLQVVRGTSEPWQPEERQAILDFRSALLGVVLKRAEELAALASGLQVANEELEAFSYSVSHDLRAPFRHISGFSEMLREEDSARMSAKGRHYLETIMESARFAGMLVDSLLDFSRFARTKITMVPVNMEDLVDHEWSASVYDEGQGRTIEFSRGVLPGVVGDPQLLRQVVRNLFSNAIKYTARQPHPRVRMEAHLEEQEIVFSIADNGVGFDQQYADKLFGVFQRLHRLEDFEGTGIGLANVRRIIGRHGGRVWAEGVVDEGATFYLSLPSSGDA